MALDSHAAVTVYLLRVGVSVTRDGYSGTASRPVGNLGGDRFTLVAEMLRDEDVIGMATKYWAACGDVRVSSRALLEWPSRRIGRPGLAGCAEPVEVDQAYLRDAR